MEVFRISKDVHAHSLRSSGSADRWNSKGQQVIYTGTSRSLSSLELVVHRGGIQPTSSHKVMVISVADDDYLMQTVHL
ncbi:RES family NAD+ phosphorylase [Spirosoma aerophilum]